jgi:hypothetical protein
MAQVFILDPEAVSRPGASSDIPSPIVSRLVVEHVPKSSDGSYD